MNKLAFRIFNPFFILGLIFSGFIFFAVMIFVRMQINELQLNKTYALPLSLVSNSHAKNKNVNVGKNIEHAHQSLPHYSYRIQFGDNLDDIFRKLHISNKEKKALLSADKKKKRLQKLKIGDNLIFWLNSDGKKLVKFEIDYNPELKIAFEKKASQKFAFREVKTNSKWQQKVIAGEVIGNFSLSAYQAGLSFTEIDEISKMLAYQINLNRDLRTGDTFSVIRSVQIVNGKATGKSEIEAVKLQTASQVYSAYLYIDGHYYDEKGLPIVRTFLRYPTKKKSMVSSHYNLDRKHPISKKSMPHKGTDFYANTGTKVITTADGIVKVARYHPKAGYFLVIDHGDRFLTRYLHNSKLLVKRGQKVKRGQVIAMSGKSGKVTGPHIHYELWVKGKPINPMKAILPSHKPVPKFQHSLYHQLVKKYNKIMILAKQVGALEGELENHYRGNTLAMKERRN